MNYIFMIFMFFVSSNVFGETIECKTKFQSYMGKEITDDYFIKNHKPSIKIFDEDLIERCHISNLQKERICETFSIDRVEKENDIKKFYVFNFQYDIQIFPDLSFMANNGRGGIEIGECMELKIF